MGLCNQVDKLFTGREIKDAACNTLPFLFFVFTVHIPALLLQVVSPHCFTIACVRLVRVTANPHRFCV